MELIPVSTFAFWMGPRFVSTTW